MSTPGSEASASPQMTMVSGIDEHKHLSEEVQLLRSCESCRRKKRKCSGDRPVCTRCKAQGECCSYRPTARFLKPRHTQNSSVHRKSPQRKKRASIPNTSAQHHQFFDHHATADGRPRAMSVVAAALKNAQRQAAAAAAASPPVSTLAPADLMLSSPLSIATGGHSPSTVSAPDLSDITDSPNRLGMASGGGLAYMSAPTPASAIAFPASENKSTAGTASPQMLLGSDMSLVTQQQQHMYPQNLAAAMVTSHQPLALCDAVDYNSLLVNAITQQQAAALMAAASPVSGVITPDTVQRQHLSHTTTNVAPAAIYSPPLSTTTSLHSAMSTSSPLADAAHPHSNVAPYQFCAQPQFGFSMWPSLPADPVLTTTSGTAPAMAAMACSPQNFFTAAGTSDGLAMAANSMTTLDAILPQSKNLFSEWFVQ
ncbi:hypothetical protein COEREDRAFT_93606 [Coemansia reversa NRRL 1564]|uniref:Zn(2)-C6 fungal-type domain-containing protein n=1 Tax=Coemansia reversa (strain ATCC 12441 / NRRL 1564) TaxID=763665 RepID=A0A2G5B7I9_COERN|nr:hypothetical protein COEREDRAFT_93606 [Coemansia reversa NRRL 1564]|eukprot:PIA14969.1 hypothetical protein COEREDRAFT_93606 [Coemansia reversa NRRL 1564]